MSPENRFNPEGPLIPNPVIGYTLLDIIQRANTDNQAILYLRSQIMGLSETNNRETLINVIAEKILNTNDLAHLSQSQLKPYKKNGQSRKTLVVSSATPNSNPIATESGCFKNTNHIVDIPGAIEIRDTRSLKVGDSSVIATKAGLTATKDLGDVNLINLADADILSLRGSDIYFKADALLLLILTNPQSAILQQIIEVIKQNPVIYPYNLDKETQLALLWLKNKAGLETLDVNANSAEVGTQLTKKGFWYPEVNQALTAIHDPNPFTTQQNEWQLSQSATEIGFRSGSVPGYLVKAESTDQFKKDVLLALMLHAARYGFDTAWTKPNQGTDGGAQDSIDIGPLSSSKRQIINTLIDSGLIDTALTIFQTHLLSQEGGNTYQRINQMWQLQKDWVIEATTHYFTGSLNLENGTKQQVKSTPSIHIIEGETQGTVSLQSFMPDNEKEWGGNSIVSKQDWINFINETFSTDPKVINNPNLITQLYESYQQMIESLDKFLISVNTSERYQNGLVRSGIDIALCALGGDFGNQLVIAFQDCNIRANGCETARALQLKAQEKYGELGTAVTRNFAPKLDFPNMIPVVEQAIREVNQKYQKNINPDQVELIAVSDGWGQIGLMGDDSLEITKNIYMIEGELRT